MSRTMPLKPIAFETADGRLWAICGQLLCDGGRAVAKQGPRAVPEDMEAAMRNPAGC